MMSIHSLALLSAAALFATNQVQAETLSEVPFIPRDGNGVTPLDKNSMVRGAPIAPFSYVDTRNGTAKMIRNGGVIGDADMLNSATNDRENTEIGYLENQYKIKFVTNAEEILQKWPRGELKKTPWPGGYWPTYMDGINVRWNNGPSSSEKYARAYGLEEQDFMNKVSLEGGIDGTQKRDYPPPACRENAECKAEGAQVVCAKRPGKDSGYCVATWEGICHAWTPAAIREDEPKCPVTIGDVTFRPNDIKGLISEVYNAAEPGNIFMGLRFDGGDNDAKDEYGRYTNYAHRDMSPAAFHLGCANLLGRSDIGFILDVDAGVQVWNQPVRSYEFQNVVTMTPNEAAQRYIQRPTYPFNKDAKKIQYVKNVLSYIVEPRSYEEDGELAAPGLVNRYTTTKQYEYLLELDDNNNIIGGEWVGDTRYNDHPDFVWYPIESPKDNYVSPAGISYDFVRMLTHLSRAVDC